MSDEVVFKSQAEAIERAIHDTRLEGGGTCTFHEPMCAMEDGEECDCHPYEVEVEGAQ